MARRRVAAKFIVPVAHADYEVHVVPKLDNGKRGPKREELLGQTDFAKKILYVEQYLAAGPWLMTFWHEWFHAVFHELGYEKDSDNEAKVDSLAQAMTRMMNEPRSRALLEVMMQKLK